MRAPSRAPTSFELAIEALGYKEKGEDRLCREFSSRKIGLVLGWASLAIDDSMKRSDFINGLNKELTTVCNYDPKIIGKEKDHLGLVEETLKSFGLQIPADLFQLNQEEYHLKTIREIFSRIVNDENLPRSLDYIPFEERKERGEL